MVVLCMGAFYFFAGACRMDLAQKKQVVPARCSAMRLVWTISLLLISVSNAFAQTPSRAVPVTGTVLDPSGAGAASSTVTLKRGGDTVLSSTEADETGRFRFAAVADGNYVVEVRREGFAVSVTPLQVRARPPAPLVIHLVLAEIVSEVSVNSANSAQLSTDITDNKNAASVNESLLYDVPVFDQDYVADPFRVSGRRLRRHRRTATDR